MGNSLDKAPEATIVVLGAPKVGKTALISRLVSNSAAKNEYAVYLYSENNTVTITSRGRNKVVEVVACSDYTDPQVRAANGIILAYDVTNKQSFDDIQKISKHLRKFKIQQDLEIEFFDLFVTYLPMIPSSKYNAKIVLTGLKSDAEGRVVSEGDGEGFAGDRGWNFLEVSARENINVDKLFHKIDHEIEDAERSETVPK